MSDHSRRVPPEGEPDFAEEHTKPTYEDESGDPSPNDSDESVPEGPASEDPGGRHRPL